MNELTFGNFQLSTCQATLFTPDEEVSSAKVSKVLLPKWANHFDGDPVVLPAETGLPREIPRLILRDKAGAWKCEIASQRINLFWIKTQHIDSVMNLNQFFEMAVKFLTEYIDYQRPRIGRMAAVLTRYAEHPTPAAMLARHFCQDRWVDGAINRPGGFELHSHKAYTLAGKFHVNSWTRSKSAQLSGDTETRPIVIVEQDLNTLAEGMANVEFSEKDVREFFTVVVDELNHVLKLYFPEES